MIQMGGFAHPFQLDISAKGRQQMVGLRSGSLSWRFVERCSLFERFRVGLHVPSFTIAGGHLVKGQGGIAGHKA